jgi:hypothetical protein
VGNRHSSSFQSPLAKRLWLYLVSPLVCITAGSVIGAAGFACLALAAGAGPDVVRGFPILVLYTLPITIPFGTLAGVVAAFAIARLGTGAFRDAVLARWLRSGSLVGGALGSAAPAFVMLIGFGGASLIDWLFYLLTGGAAGAAAGGLLGAIGWREFHEPVQLPGEVPGSA